MEEMIFLRELEEQGIKEINLKLYYGLDEKEDVILDVDSMKLDFEEKLKEIQEILNENEQ